MASAKRQQPAHYMLGERDVSYEEDLVGKVFLLQTRGTKKYTLVKVYRRNGGKMGHESVAVMDTRTNEHIGFPSISRLIRAIPIEQTFGEMLVAYLKSIDL